MKDRAFTHMDTNAAKGVAICLVLYHHLFFSYPESVMIIIARMLFIGPKMGDVPVLEFFSIVAKVGVAMFVLLSGYGLNESVRRNHPGLKGFFAVRLARIYVPYWFIWLVFVPVAYFGFGMTFSQAYGTGVVGRILMDLTGVQLYFGHLGYNPTWYFISLILGLYLLFPLIRLGMVRFKTYALGVSALALLVPPSFPLWFITIYVFPFTLGAYLSERDIFQKVARFGGWYLLPKALAYAALVALFLWQRQYGVFRGHVFAAPTALDGPLSLVFILVLFEFVSWLRPLYRGLAFIGKHSYNIFLFHTFLYYYFFTDLLYSLPNSWTMFLALLAACLVISAGLEWLQHVAGRRRLYDWLRSVRFREPVRL